MHKRDVFKTINTQLKYTCILEVSRSTLYKMWKQEFGHVKTPTKQKMSKCKTCDDLKSAFETTSDTRMRDRYIQM